MLFSEFSSALERALKEVQSQTECLPPASSRGFRFRWGKDTDTVVPPGSVLIGFAYEGPARPVDYLALNNKAPGDGLGEATASVTLMLQNWQENQWRTVRDRLKVEEHESPDDFLAKRTVLVEDASPDSVFAFYLLLLHLAGVSDHPELTSYISAVNRWEQGDTLIPGEYTAFWPVLHSALAHLLFQRHDPSNPDRHDNQSLTMSWVRSLRLLHHAIQHYAVDCISEKDPLRELHLARNACEYERQIYRNVRQRFEPLQLLVPLRDVPDRNLLVDTLFVTEEIPSGIGKVLIRNDDTSYTGKGFGLQAMYRPDLMGTGNDLTVSSDTRWGLDLSRLWEVLERLEFERADAEGRPRPTDKPRKGELLNRLQDDRKLVRVNQPWYINDGADLVGAPRAINSGIDPRGTLLRWDDVRDTIWQLYHPAREIEAEELSVAECEMADDRTPTAAVLSGPGPLIQPGPAPGVVASGRGDSQSHRKRIRAFRFHTNSRVLSFLLTPTMKRIFGALIAREDREVSVQSLPSEHALDVLSLRGGFIVASAEGAILFDDWRDERLDVGKATQELRHALKRFEAIEGKGKDGMAKGDATEHETGFKERMRAIRQEILGTDGKTRASDKQRFLHRLNQLKMEMEALWRDTEPESDWKEMRAVVERRWGMEGVIESLYDSADRLESTLRTMSDLKTGGLIFALSFYGFPFVALANFFSYAMGGWMSYKAGAPEQPGVYYGIHVTGLATYVGLSLALIGVLKGIAWIVDRRNRKGGAESKGV